MGFRYRKSINLGGGFRVNLSKSGVGYSWGVKGYRVTKTAKGTIRRTVSIPGTGTSYVTETGSRKRQNTQQGQQATTPVKNNNHYDIQEITNSVASSMVSDGLEDILLAARKTLRFNQIAHIGFWFSLVMSTAYPLFILLLLAFIALKIYVKKTGLINLDYSIDEDQKEMIDERMAPMLKATESSKVWRITQTSKVIDKKYASGASNTIKRTPCKVSREAPFPFKSNIPSATFKSVKETLIFLPDKLFIIQGTQIGALNYFDISTATYTTRFIESEKVPKDAKVVDKTWRYVNKSGGPDKRFKDNKELPICLYGKIELKSKAGLNTVIMFSNANWQ